MTKKLFIFQTHKGYGKGWSLPAAILAYESSNGKFKTSLDMFCEVMVFTGAKSFSDVSVDTMNVGTMPGVERIV